MKNNNVSKKDIAELLDGQTDTTLNAVDFKIGQIDKRLDKIEIRFGQKFDKLITILNRFLKRFTDREKLGVAV